jgi:hypothetical protein
MSIVYGPHAINFQFSKCSMCGQSVPDGVFTGPCPVNQVQTGPSLDAIAQQIRESNFTLYKELKDLKDKVSFISVEITPSVCCKSNKEQTAKFSRLNEALRLDVSPNIEGSVIKLTAATAQELLQGTPPVDRNFAFTWNLPKKDATKKGGETEINHAPVRKIKLLFIQLLCLTCHFSGSRRNPGQAARNK